MLRVQNHVECSDKIEFLTMLEPFIPKGLDFFAFNYELDEHDNGLQIEHCLDHIPSKAVELLVEHNQYFRKADFCYEYMDIIFNDVSLLTKDSAQKIIDDLMLFNLILSKAVQSERK